MQNLIYEMRRLRGMIPEEIRCKVVRRIGCAIHRTFKDKQQVFAFVRACKLDLPASQVPPETTMQRTNLAAFLDRWIPAVGSYDSKINKIVPLTPEANDIRITMLTELMEFAGLPQEQIDSMKTATVADSDELELVMASALSCHGLSSKETPIPAVQPVC